MFELYDDFLWEVKVKKKKERKFGPNMHTREYNNNSNESCQFLKNSKKMGFCFGPKKHTLQLWVNLVKKSGRRLKRVNLVGIVPQSILRAHSPTYYFGT